MITYLIGFLYVVEVVACLLLGLVVMLQKPKEGGLGGLAGGMGEAVFGADAGNVLIKVTIWLGAIFLANTLVLARLTSKANSKSLMAGEKAPVPVQQMPALPPAAPAARVAATWAPTFSSLVKSSVRSDDSSSCPIDSSFSRSKKSAPAPAPRRGGCPARAGCPPSRRPSPARRARRTRGARCP